MSDRIDLVIPRGGPGLIQRVMDAATMPVLKHESGICHVYVDEAADLEMATEILINSKCQRPGVCNACESLLVHQAIAASFLPLVTARLLAESVEIRADEVTRRYCSQAIPITDADDRTEYLDRIISVRVVGSLQDAMAHIDRFGSGHTDTIVTEDRGAARAFCQNVDSSAVLVNASTRLNDGSQLGLGAEIGISTDRLHARGPCGLRELTTYKYICQGDGQIRE
jgi:glutamate-5-semialdehyde dehydrogenase